MRKLLALALALVLVLTTMAVPALAETTEEPVTLSVFIDHSWYPTDKFEGIIPEEITRLTGVKLDVTVAVDSSQLGVMVASGELPDLIYTYDNVALCSNPDISYPIEELIAQYNVDWQPSPEQLAVGRLFSEDGVVYTIKNQIVGRDDWKKYPSFAPMLSSILIRKGVYEEVGAPKLNSLDDLSNFFAAVKEKHPEMICLGMRSNSWNIRPLLDNVGIGSLPFIPDETGAYRHYTEDPRYLELLTWLNDCYLKGYISPDDGYFQGTEESTIPLENYLTFLECTQGNYKVNDLKAAGCDDELFEMVPFDSVNYTSSGTGWSGTFITRSCSNPEAAIKLLAFLFSEEGQKLSQMGREGYEYTVDADGNFTFSDEWIDANNNGTLVEKYNPWFYFGGSPIIEAISRILPENAPHYKDAYLKMNAEYTNLPQLSAAMPVGSGDDAIMYEKLKEMVKAYEAKMILCSGADEVKALYDEYITNAQKVGLEQIDANYNTKLAEILPLFGE